MLNITFSQRGGWHLPTYIFVHFQRVYKNLHIFIAINPVDPKFRYCCKKYSSIISSCTIDWYERWNEQALLLIANSFLSEYVDFENREVKKTSLKM